MGYYKQKRKHGNFRTSQRRYFKGLILQHYYGFTPEYRERNKPLFLYEYPCYFCKKSFPFYELTLDHLLPLSRGGSLKSLDNLDVACEPCNQRKSDLTIEEYIIKFAVASYLLPRRGILKEEE